MKHDSLLLAISVALCSHILLYSLLRLWPAPEPELHKSIPVTLIVSPDQIASKQSALSTANNQSGTVSSTITTTGSSPLKSSAMPESKEKIESTQTDQNRTSQKNLDNSRQAQVNRANSVRQIFSSELKDQPKINALTERAEIEMSDYEKALLQHLLDGNLYSDFHRFMRLNNETQIDIRLRLVLFRNGAIKNASLEYQNKQIDIAPIALRAAYSASPYPRPPEEDYEINYTYRVSMTYKENEINQ